MRHKHHICATRPEDPLHHEPLSSCPESICHRYGYIVLSGFPGPTEHLRWVSESCAHVRYVCSSHLCRELPYCISRLFISPTIRWFINLALKTSATHRRRRPVDNVQQLQNSQLLDGIHTVVGRMVLLREEEDAYSSLIICCA
jgi:hypothetical protein